MKLWSRFVLPVSLLAGTIIGAGMFSLPYTFKTAGVLPSVLYALLFCGIAVAIYFMYADMLEKHPGMRYMGLMRRYFGSRGYYLSFLIDIAQQFLVLTIYVVLSESFIVLIFPRLPLHWGSILFWAASSLFLFLKAKHEAIGEFLATAGIVCIVAAIAALGAGRFFSGGFSGGFSWEFILLPFGSLLFSFNGRSVIPELLRNSGHEPARLRRAIAWGTAVPLILYLFFVAGVIGLSPVVVPDSVSGLIGLVPPSLLAVLGILGLLALWSSYIAVGADVRKTLSGDASMRPVAAGIAVVLFPVLLYAAGMRSFLALVALTGGVLTALEWIGIVCMWKRSCKEKEGLLLPSFSRPLFFGTLAVLLAGCSYTVYLLLVL